MPNKTQIRGNQQIKSLSIGNNQIASNAGIETSKLAEGAELLKRDGSVELTGDLNAGGNKLENVGAPVDNNDAVRKVDLDSAVSALSSEIAAEEVARQNADQELDGRLDTAEGDIVALEGRMDSVESKNVEQDGRLDTAEGDIVALEGRMDTAESDIAALEAADIVIDGRLDQVEQDISDEEAARILADQNLQDQIDALDGELGGDVSGLASRITTAEGEIDALQAEDIVLDGRLDVAESDIVALEAADVILDSRLSALELFKDAQLVYVAKNGNDSTGNGGEHKPYLTIAAAMASITDASATKRYVVKVKPGSYTETGNLALKANVMIVGEHRDMVRIGATSFVMDSSFSGSADNRSGFSQCVLLNACNFDWSTVTSAAGKLYFNEVMFNSTVTMYGHNNAIAQAQFNSCVFFNTFTVSGINVGAHTNNTHYGNIVMNQHPNGGMATILAATGGVVGTVTLNASVNDFNRRCSLFARSFYMDTLSVNGPSAYADMTEDSQPREKSKLTRSNGGNIVYLNSNIPYESNVRSFGDVGRQYLYNFNYVNASTGTDLYVISMGTDYAADSSGKNVFIEADSYGLNSDVNGGDINLNTASVSGSGIRGKVKIDARELDLNNKKIVNVADGVSAKDAVNVSQLSAVQSDVSALDGRLDTAEGEIDALQAEDVVLDGRLDVVESGLAQEILDRQAGVQEAKDYADDKIADLVNGAPAVLDTLKELADALGNDENFATTIAGQIGDLDSRLDTAEGDIVALEGRMDTAESDISDLEAADIALDGRVDSLEAADVALDGRMDSVESKNIEQDGRLDDLESSYLIVNDRLDNLDDADAAIDGRLDLLEAEDLVIDGRLDLVESKNTEQDGRLDDLEADLAEATAGAFIAREVPVGLIDGVNASFALSNAVNPGSEQVYLNGILQNVGAGNDYTISGDTITFNQAPEVDSILLVSYISDAIIIGSGGSGGGATNLNGLSDVNLVTPASGEVLKFNGTQWVNGDVSYNDLADKPVIEDVVLNNFNSTLAPSSGTLTLDVAAGSVVLGDLDASVTTWAFTNVPVGNGKVANVTVIIDGDTAQTYGDACSINGSSVSGGIKWSGGSAPTATNNFDIITFTIVRDNAGTVHVFGSSTTNFS